MIGKSSIVCLFFLFFSFYFSLLYPKFILISLPDLLSLSVLSHFVLSSFPMLLQLLSLFSSHLISSVIKDSLSLKSKSGAISEKPNVFLSL